MPDIPAQAARIRRSASLNRQRLNMEQRRWRVGFTGGCNNIADSFARPSCDASHPLDCGGPSGCVQVESVFETPRAADALSSGAFSSAQAIAWPWKKLR